MTEPTPKAKPTKGPVIFTIILVVFFAFIFLIAFVISSTSIDNAPTTVTADSYLVEVQTALEGADPTIGEQLIADQNCTVCHVLGDGKVAPLFTGIANRASERHPPLGAEQYLYEAIMFPSAFVLADYANSMPNNYGDLLTQQEIGHIIAYLLTLTEETSES